MSGIGSSPTGQPAQRPRRLPAFELLLAAALGAAHTLAFVDTRLWWLQLLAVAGVAWRASGARPAHAAAIGLVFGTTWLASGTWWLYISLHTYGGLPAWLTALAIALLSGALSLYLAAALAGFARWRGGASHRLGSAGASAAASGTGASIAASRAGTSMGASTAVSRSGTLAGAWSRSPSGALAGAFADALLFGALWLLAELARGVIFTGFPWIASGYAHVDGPLGALAPWIGVYGIGFVGAVLAAWPVLCWRWARSADLPGRGYGSARNAGLFGRNVAGIEGVAVAVPAAVLAGVLGAAAVLGPGRFTQAGGVLKVTLLQGNVPQQEKFARSRMPEALAWTREQLLAARGDIVIAPETVIPLLPSQLDPGYWQALTSHFGQGPQAALLGLPLGDRASGYTNSAAGLSAAAAALPGGFYRYDKHHLVPFGEFIPLGFKWFTRLMNIPLGDFNRGPVGAASFEHRGERIGVNICYEDLFGEELAARFAGEVDGGALGPTIFANISNIGWFGNTIAIDQHLQISRMRALEFQRPMVRSTNTGATVVIDHQGRVTHALPRFTQGVLDGEVQGRRGLTPFVAWSARFGLWPLLLVALLIVGWRAVRHRGTRHGNAAVPGSTAGAV